MPCPVPPRRARRACGARCGATARQRGLGTLAALIAPRPEAPASVFKSAGARATPEREGWRGTRAARARAWGTRRGAARGAPGRAPARRAAWGAALSGRWGAMMQQRRVGVGGVGVGGAGGGGARPRGVGASLVRMDAFGVAERHLQQRTGGGAAVSIAGVVMMVVLLVSEVAHFVSPGVESVMGVDMRHTGEEKLGVHLELRFLAMPCELLSIDTLDISGGHEANADTRMEKTRLGADGAPLTGDAAQYVPPPFPKMGLPLDAAAGDLIVQRATGALQRGEGCAVSGHLDVARVAGNFHASVHAQSYAVLQTLLSKEDLHGRSALNMSHTIDALSFGPEYPGVVNPLDGAVRIIEDETDLHGSTKYARAARLLVWAPADISTLPWPKSSLTADASARAYAVNPPLALPLAFRKVLPQARADDVRVRPGRRSRV